MGYLKRYEAGEHVAVWQELSRLGESVRDELLFSEAMAVARETMRRIRFNVEELHKRLLDMRFQFLHPGKAYIPPSSDIATKITELEAIAGMLPLSLHAWYEVVGEVNFQGDHPVLARYYGPGPVSDPLVVEGIDEALADDHVANRDCDGSYALDIAPDILFKSYYSGAGPVILELPNKGMDGVLLELPYRPVYFINYLRISISCGGFAGFYPYSKLEFDNSAHRDLWLNYQTTQLKIPTDIIERLTKDLLPF
jgi:hypothetical protein